MMKLALDRLSRKVRPTKAKEVVTDTVTDTAASTVRRVRKKTRHWIEKTQSKSQYERTPNADTVEVSPKAEAQKAEKKKKEEEKDTKNRIWYFFEQQRKRIAAPYTRDLEAVAQEIPEASFSPDANICSVKGLDSTLKKLKQNEKMFAQGGFNTAVRDGVRGTLFIPDPQKDYTKIIKAMEKRGYRIDETFLEKDGMVVLDKNGLPKMGKDIDVRFGDNAVPSGYEDVQVRFYKGQGRNKKIYELIILPGPNYLNFKNKEHELIYEQFRDYKDFGFREDRGAKSIINSMKDVYNSLTRRLYADAKSRDVNGAASVTEAITFSKKDVKQVKEYMKSLKELFAGKYAMLPPSKQVKPFRETQKYKKLDELEQKLLVALDIYKPIEK